ncbi:MAG TPA: flippase activity-associated protein Agl23, partial [Dehalococcoidia bacterium]|nr:flippase activity-associated protein Agl23 [Dehalococcoidia bacterium]
SRFIRNDIFIVVWDLLLVIGMWRFLERGRRADLLLVATALGLSFSTKEVTYLTVIIFGSYLLFTSLRELLPRVFPRFKFRDVSPRVGLLITMGTLSLPLGSAGAGILWKVVGFAPEDTTKLMAGGLVVALLTGLSALIGWRWNWSNWLAAVALFYGIFIVLHTTFFTNLSGLGSGVWGALDYWVAQQGVQRGNQPWFYYFLLLPIYEFLPIALALVGALYFRLGLHLVVGAVALALLPGVSAYLGWEWSWWQWLAAAALFSGVFFTLRFRDEFSRFLLWWIVASFILYGYAGEKMPWLSLHMALPLILLAGKTLGAFLQGMAWRDLWEKGALYLGLIVLLIPLALRALVSTGDPFQDLPGQTLRMLQALAAAAALAFLLGSAWQLARGLGLKLAGQTLLLLSVVVLGGLTVRAAWQASYFHGDIPVEMLVYTQTSPEVPRIRDTIERIAGETNQGKNLPITVDAKEGFTWPWAWYLRDYKNVDYPDLGAAPAEPRGTVLLLNINSQGGMQRFLSKYETGQKFPHRWWFPEDYRNLTLPRMLASILDPAEWSKWWSYFYNREVGAPLGSSDSLVYYPKGFSSGAGLLARSPEPSPASPSPPRPELPQPILMQSDLIVGKASGGLLSPKDVAVDAQGNFYVVDSEAASVVKFDPSGRVLARVGRSGSGDGEFNQPWGIAVDRSGNVYVADTWNHRIQKFDAGLKFLGKWGSFASVPTGGKENPGKLYGPRDIAVDAEGNLHVTDAGNKRVQEFSPDGKVLGVFGEVGNGKGQFQEPVGIAISPSGEILVADTWNLRVQRFTKEFKYVGEFPVAGWAGQNVLNKPYLSTDKDGNILLTDPESHHLLEYSSTGVLLKVLGRFGSDSSSFNLPAAVA